MNSKALLKQAREHLDKQEYNATVELCRSVLEQDPEVSFQLGSFI
jgi:hypothetical protein